jgi:hypothetical protein
MDRETKAEESKIKVRMLIGAFFHQDASGVHIRVTKPSRAVITTPPSLYTLQPLRSIPSTLIIFSTGHRLT